MKGRVTRTNSISNSESNANSSERTLKPLPEPSSIGHVLLLVVLHACKRVVFFDTKVRLLAYLTLLFALSGIADVTPLPRIQFSTSDNLFNRYFVKWGWFWTLVTCGPFVWMTSVSYCCGKRSLVLQHISRLLIGTFFWFTWVNLFVYAQRVYGQCENRSYFTKAACRTAGFRWKGLDVSGHAFILIYSTLLLVEEMRPMVDWEGIGHLIEEERYSRSTGSKALRPLRSLTAQQLESLHHSYHRYLPFVRIAFVVVTLLVLLWDFMLLLTILYFHSMPEKLIAGLVAILTWYVTYRLWYPSSHLFPCEPGHGLFKYTSSHHSQHAIKKSLSTKNNVPTFMGMPLMCTPPRNAP